MNPDTIGCAIGKLGLHVVPPYWFIFRYETGHDFATSSDSKTSRFNCPGVIGFVADSIFFHVGERIYKYPDPLPNSPNESGIQKEKVAKYRDPCGRGLEKRERQRLMFCIINCN